MKSNKHDYIRFFKPCMIVALILFVVSAVFLAVMGFNKGFDFTGGSQIVVEFESTDVQIENKEELNNAAKEIKNILKDNNADVVSFQTQGEYGATSFVISIKPLSDEKVDAIRVAINTKYNTSAEFAALVAADNADDIVGKPTDMTRQTTKIDGLIEKGVLLTTIASLLFALSLLVVYACFRVSAGGALSMLLGSLMSVLGTLCFALVVRIELNTYVFAALGVVMLANIISSADLLFSIKDKSKDVAYAGLTTYDLANLAVETSWHKNLAKYIIAFVATVVVGALTVPSVLHLSILTFAGLVISFALTTYVTPAFYANFNRTRTKVSAQKVELNNTDKNAEEIEIKE